MRIEEVSQPENWNSWIADCAFGDILQSWEWGEIKKSELWRTLRVRVVDKEKVVAQAQVLTRRLPMGMTLYYVPRGPVLDYTSPEAEIILKILMEWLREHAARHRALMIKIGPAVSEVQVPEVRAMLGRVGFRKSFKSVQAEYTRVVDLGQSTDDLMASFDKDTRNLVRRSEREGVTVVQTTGSDDPKALRTFHNLYMAAVEHGQFAARPWDQFTKMWELMAPQGMAVIHIASADGVALAGNFTLCLGSSAYQLYAGSRRDAPKKFATYGLQWATMTDLQKMGIKRYDMWGVSPSDDDKTHSWAGLSLFKKGFNGERVTFMGDYDLPLSPAYPAFDVADRLRSKLLAR